MIHELACTEFGRARALFSGFDYSLSIQAAIERNNPGRIFVDDPHCPRTALALTVEGYLLAGETDNPDTNLSLQHFLRDRIFSGELFINGNDSMSLAVHPHAWEAKLPQLIPTHDAEKIERCQYLCRRPALDGRRAIPSGYSIQRVDQNTLHGGEAVFARQVREWMDIEQIWGSEESFFSRGISCAALYDRQVVAWCTPDCVAGDRMDVGVFTHPDHRRRGLASAVVAATVTDCLDNGFTAVGWHCNAENTASCRTAEKVGFERNRQYAYYYYMYDPVDHLAELGWYYYRRGEYARCVKYYDRVFATRGENPDYYYHLAASAWALLGDADKALVHLKEAANHGWSNAAFTQQQREFSSLRGRKEWDSVVARMEANRRDD